MLYRKKNRLIFYLAFITPLDIEQRNAASVASIKICYLPNTGNSSYFCERPNIKCISIFLLVFVIFASIYVSKNCDYFISIVIHHMHKYFNRMTLVIPSKATDIMLVYFIQAQPQLQRYTLPSGADLLLPGGYNTGFSCEGRIYGYYADTTNDCHVFYVCVPVTDEAGITTTYQYPFICGNQTKFNQVR